MQSFRSAQQRVDVASSGFVGSAEERFGAVAMGRMRFEDGFIGEPTVPPDRPGDRPSPQPPPPPTAADPPNGRPADTPPDRLTGRLLTSWPTVASPCLSSPRHPKVLELHHRRVLDNGRRAVRQDRGQELARAACEPGAAVAHIARSSCGRRGVRADALLWSGPRMRC